LQTCNRREFSIVRDERDASSTQSSRHLQRVRCPEPRVDCAELSGGPQLGSVQVDHAEAATASQELFARYLGCSSMK